MFEDLTLNPKGDCSKWELHDRIFSEDNMYEFVVKTASEKNLTETLRALPIMKMYHKGQTRKGREHIPFINHPLLMASHALSLGFEEDNLITAILLHDVCEDCGIEPEELPFNEEIRKAVALVTFKRNPGENNREAHDRYYSGISENRLATITKIIDRCNNISSMATAFDKKHILSYIEETEHYVLPLIAKLKTYFDGQYADRAFLIQYHMLSVIESEKHILLAQLSKSIE